jgi:hypothetical protein
MEVSRFDELMKSGLPWINVSCYGVDRGRLVIGVELPRSRPRATAETSVSFSGATSAVLLHDWDVREVLAFDLE